MIKAILIAGAALVAQGAVARAQTPAELTLRAAIEAALRSHPALELAYAGVDRARSGVKDARGPLKPSLSFDGQAVRHQEPMVVAPIHGFDPDNLPSFDRTLMQAGLSLSYLLFDAGRGARIERARALESAAATSEDAARIQVIAETTRLWLRLRSARETSSAHDYRVRALEAERSRAAQLVEQGRAARVVLLRAEAALSSARADGAALQSAETDALQELARQMNVSAHELAGMTMSGNTAAPRIPAAVEAMREIARHAPDVERLRRQVEAAQAQQGEARALWLPRVLAGGRFVEYASAETSPQGEWQAGLQLSYAVLGGGRDAARDRASAEVRAARAELELALRRVDDAIDRTFSAFVTASSRVNALTAAVAQSEEIVRIEKLSLSEGAGVQSDYLLAEAELFRARAGLSEARTQVQLSIVEVGRLSGALSPEWIATNVEPGQ